MARRIKDTSIKNWAKSSASFLTVGLLFLISFNMLIEQKVITVGDYDSNVICGGDDVCWLELYDVCYKQDVFYYPMNPGEIINASPSDTINSMNIYRSWGKGWREIDFNDTCTSTWCGAKRNSYNNKYSWAARAGKCYDIRIEVYKDYNSSISWNINPEGNWLSKDDIVELDSNTPNCMDCFTDYLLKNPTDTEICDNINVSFIYEGNLLSYDIQEEVEKESYFKNVSIEYNTKEISVCEFLESNIPDNTSFNINDNMTCVFIDNKPNCTDIGYNLNFSILYNNENISCLNAVYDTSSNVYTNYIKNITTFENIKNNTICINPNSNKTMRIKGNIKPYRNVDNIIHFSKFSYPEYAWWDSTSLESIIITINHSKVDTTLTDFPLLIKLNASILNFSKVQSEGQDIRFGNATSVYLNYEIEYWNSTSQEAIVWVKIPSISSTTDTEFRMWYNNPTALDGQNKTGVWNNDFVGVWHLSENGTNDRIDSTNVNNLSVNNFEGNELVNAKIDGGVYLDATEDLNATDDPSLNPSTYITLETWIKVSSFQDASPYISGIISKSIYGADSYILRFGDKNLGKDKLQFIIDGEKLDGTYTYQLDTWYYIAATYDRSNMRIYRDGFQEVSLGETGAITVSTDYLMIGRDHEDRYTDSTIDEVRISDVTRSADWIETSYYSMTDTLVTYSSPISNDCTIYVDTVFNENKDCTGQDFWVTNTSTAIFNNSNLTSNRIHLSNESYLDLRNGKFIKG